MARVFLGSYEYLVTSVLKNIMTLPNSHSFSVYISYESSLPFIIFFPYFYEKVWGTIPLIF